MRRRFTPWLRRAVELAPSDAKVWRGRQHRQTDLDGLPLVSPPQRRVTDKWVETFKHLGLTHARLPIAAIIHCRRDARDACLSCFATPFVSGQDYSHDPTELAGTGAPTIA